MRWQDIMSSDTWKKILAASGETVAPGLVSWSSTKQAHETAMTALGMLGEQLEQYQQMNKLQVAPRLIALRRLEAKCEALSERVASKPKAAAAVQLLAGQCKGKADYLTAVMQFQDPFDSDTKGKGVDMLRNIVNLLVVPGARALQMDYWIEKFDPAHRPGTGFNPFRKLYWTWLLKAEVDETVPPFFIWLEANSGELEQKMLELDMSTEGVAYLDGAERLHAVISIDDAGKTWATSKTGPQPFDTTGWQSTGFPGFGAFVVATDGTLYAHEHQENQFHHSSFLSGGQVLAAGMIRAEGGAIKDITPKSGHYKPRLKDFRRLVSLLERKGALKQASIRWTDFDAKDHKEKTYTPQEFLEYAVASHLATQFKLRAAAKKVSGQVPQTTQQKK